MKIGFLITYFYPATGGAENNCYYLAKELAKKHEVHVFCSGEEESEEIINNIHIHRSKEVFRFKYYLAAYPTICSSILKYKLDILHVHGLGFPQHDFAISRIKTKNPSMKLVCTPHGPFMALKKYTPMIKLTKFLYTLMIKRNLRRYDAIIQVNPHQFSWLTKEYDIPKSKIYFLPNGIDKSALSKVSLKDKNKTMGKYNLENKFIITYLGRIQEYKGLRQVIEVLPELIELNPNLVFVAMGKDKGEKAYLSELGKKLNVEKNIIFTGEVSEKNKFSMLSLSDIFIFPSEWEAFGIVMLEAMAQNNAIVSSKTEGGLYLIKPGVGGYLFEYGNKTQMIEKISILLKNPASLDKMQKFNHNLSAKYLWPDIAKDLERIYKSLS